jgi:hypothetical protein
VRRRAEMAILAYGFAGGVWNGDSVGNYGRSAYMQTSTIQLPFNICLSGYCSNVLTVGTDGYMTYNDLTTGTAVTMAAYRGQDGQLYIYPGNNGVYYRIAGTTGQRSLTVAWYAGTNNQGYEQNHFTITNFEGTGTLKYKYYNIIQCQNTGGAAPPQASAYLNIGKRA